MWVLEIVCRSYDLGQSAFISDHPMLRVFNFINFIIKKKLASKQNVSHQNRDSKRLQFLARLYSWNRHSGAAALKVTVSLTLTVIFCAFLHPNKKSTTEGFFFFNGICQLFKTICSVALPPWLFLVTLVMVSEPLTFHLQRVTQYWCSHSPHLLGKVKTRPFGAEGEAQRAEV